MSVRTDRCFDFTCFSIENTDSQTYVDPNIYNVLSAACLTLGYFSVGTLFQNSMVPSFKARFSWSSSQRLIISNSAAASSVTSGAFKQSVSALNGLTRNVICGLFSLQITVSGQKAFVQIFNQCCITGCLLDQSSAGNFPAGLQ